jgi:hypothetical protein
VSDKEEKLLDDWDNVNWKPYQETARDELALRREWM